MPDNGVPDFVQRTFQTFGIKEPEVDITPLLERMRGGTMGQESGGAKDPQRVKNPRTSATGLFQVMPANIPAWSETHYGQRLTPEQFADNPDAQHKVFTGEMGRYLKKARASSPDDDTAIRKAAAAWYGGEGAMHRFDDPVRFRPDEPSFREYTSSVLRRSSQQPATPELPDFAKRTLGMAAASSPPATPDVPDFVQRTLQNFPSQRPIPEAPDTIEEQRKSALDPKSPRAAVLTTTPEQNAIFAAEPTNWLPAQTKDGMVWVSAAKARRLKLRTPQDVQMFLDNNPDAMTRLIGKVDNVGNETDRGATVLTTKDGKEVSASIVTNPASAKQQIEIDQASFPGATSEIVTPQDVIDLRTAPQMPGSGRAKPTQPTSQQVKQPVQPRNEPQSGTVPQYDTSEPLIYEDLDDSKVSQDTTPVDNNATDEQILQGNEVYKVDLVGAPSEPRAREAMALDQVFNRLVRDYGVDPAKRNEFMQGRFENGLWGDKVELSRQAIAQLGGDVVNKYRERSTPARAERRSAEVQEEVAKRELESRVKEPDYSWQQRLTNAFSAPFVPDEELARMNETERNVMTGSTPDEKWVSEEMTRLIQQHGSGAKALEAEKVYQNADGLEKTLRTASQTMRSFAKNLVSGTGKGAIFLSQLAEPYIGLNALLPDESRIGLRNLGNAADFATRLLTAPSAKSAYDESEWIKSSDPIIQQQAFKAMQEFDKAIGDDPVLKGRFLGALGDAGGSALSFVALGMLAPSLSTTTKLGEFGITSAIAGGVQQAGSGYEEGVRSGLSEDQAKAYGVIQGLLGATEGFGVGGAIGSSIKNANVRRNLALGILQAAKRGGKEEFFQEVFQSTGGKVALEWLKDNDPSAYQKVKNALTRLPKQIAGTIVNEGLIATLTGSAVGGASQGITDIATREDASKPSLNIKPSLSKDPDVIEPKTGAVEAPTGSPTPKKDITPVPEAKTSPEVTERVETPRTHAKINLPVERVKGESEDTPLRSAVDKSQGNTPASESLANSLATHTDLLRDVTKTASFRQQGLDGFDAPSQRIVRQSVLSVIQDPQIRDNVIRLVPVEMVNILRSQKLTPKMLFHNVPMLTNLLSVNRDNAVPFTVDESAKLASGITRLVAKHVSTRFNERRTALNPSTTLNTSAFDTGGLGSKVARVGAKNASNDLRGSSVNSSVATNAIKSQHNIFYDTDTGLSTIDLLDPNDPNILKKVRTRESESLLKSLKGKTFEVAEIESLPRPKLTNLGVELNEDSIEYLRQTVEAKGYGDQTFDGIFNDPKQTKEIISALKEDAETLSKYSPKAAKSIANLAYALEQDASKHQGTAVAYIYEDAGKHEGRHRASYKGAVDKALSRRYDKVKDLPKNPLFQRAFKAFQKLENHNWTNPTDTQLGHGAEEILAHFGDGNFLGLSLNEATDLAYELFNRYANARIKENPDLTRETALNTFDGHFSEELLKGARNEQSRETGESGGKGEGGTAESPRGSPKNRKYAQTLREEGRAIDDVPYIPETETGWIRGAKKILKESAQNESDPYKNAIKEFNSPDINPDAKVVLGIALIDHLGAMGDVAAMEKVAETTVNTTGRAAQALRASQLVSKYDFAKGVQLTVKALQSQGKKLTEKHVDKIRDLTEKYAEAERNRMIADGARLEAEEAVRDLQSQIDEITKTLGEKPKGKIEGLKEKIADWFKNDTPSILRMASPSTPFNKLEQEILNLGNQDIAEAAIHLNRAKNTEDWKAAVDNPSAQLFKEARQLVDKAKQSLEKQRMELRQGIRLTQKEFNQLKNEQKVARAKVRKNKSTLDRYYRELTKSTAEKGIDIALDIFSLPKSLMATGEISYILRQGYLPLTLFTKDALRGLKGVAKGFQSDTNRAIYEESLREDPYFGDAQAHGVEFGQIGDAPIIDEHFTSRIFEKLSESRIPIANQLAKAQQKFEYAYTLPGDAQRLFVYTTLAKIAESQNLTFEQEQRAKKFAGSIANKFTGRGDIRGIFNPGGTFGKFINALGFSPKWVASRFQSAFYLSPFSLPFVPEGMRRTMAQKQLRFSSLMLTFASAFALLLDPGDDENPWSILDPASKNFLKGRIKGTDYHVDFTGGMSEPMRLTFYNWIGSGYYASTGQWNKFKDIWKHEKERYLVTSHGEPLRFFRGKLSPSSSYIVDALAGKDYIGNEFDWWAGAKSRLAPLTYQQAYDALVYDPYESAMREPLKDTTGTEGTKFDRLWKGEIDPQNALTVLILAGLGMQIQQYAKVESTDAEDKAWSMWESKYPSKKTEEQKRAERGVRTLYRIQQAMTKDGLDTKAVDSAITKYAQKYKVTKLNELREQATGSRFEFVTKDMTPEQVEILINEYASEKEKTELQQILTKKQTSKVPKQEKKEKSLKK